MLLCIHIVSVVVWCYISYTCNGFVHSARECHKLQKIFNQQSTNLLCTIALTCMHNLAYFYKCYVDCFLVVVLTCMSSVKYSQLDSLSVYQYKHLINHLVLDGSECTLIRYAVPMKVVFIQLEWVGHSTDPV